MDETKKFEVGRPLQVLSAQDNICAKFSNTIKQYSLTLAATIARFALHLEEILAAIFLLLCLNGNHLLCKD